MENFLLYIGKVALATAAFYLVFLVLFQNKKQFVFNRLYLPVSFVLSFIIPLITFTRVQYVAPIENTFDLNSLAYLANPTGTVQAKTGFEWYQYLFMLYLLVAFVFAIKLLLGHLKAMSIISGSKVRVIFSSLVNITLKDVHPFSFFNKIVISEKTLSDPNLGMIISHEEVHVREKHTIDILVGEVLFLLQWFNPFAWLLKDAMKNNLEYKTDAEIIKNHDPKAYQLAMLGLADKSGVAPFLTALNGSQLKNRIIMMKQKTENKNAIIKQLLVLPLLAILVMGLSSKKYVTEFIEEDPPKAMNQLVVPNGASEFTAVLEDGTKVYLQAGSKITYPVKFAEDKRKITIEGEAYFEVKEDPSRPFIIKSGNTLFTEEQLVAVRGSKSMKKVPVGTEEVQLEKNGFIVKGRVTDEKGEPLSGVNIIIKGKTVSTMTDNEGNYIIKVSDNKSVLVFMYSGNEKVEKVVGKEREINVTFKSNPKPEKKDLGEIKITSYRGISGNPLLIVDGKEYDARIERLEPKDIESMSVLKGEKAIEKFGEKGKNGVIIVEPKRKDKNQLKINSEDKPYPETKIKNVLEDAEKAVLILVDGKKVESIKDVGPESLASVEMYNKYGEKVRNAEDAIINITTKKKGGVEVIGYGKYKKKDKIAKNADGKLFFGEGKNQPLILLDGEEVEDTNSIDPGSIESVSVLKNASATAIYGEKGKNGVVIITTKKGVPDKAAITRNTKTRVKINGEEIKASPLVLVDGKEVEDTNSIDSESIESVSVLKDASATAIYGEKGKNGVVIITTKKGVLDKTANARNTKTGVKIKGRAINGQPLLIINGKESSKMVNEIDPGEIKAITVVKNKEAIEKYGAKAENGAIEITLKNGWEVNSVLDLRKFIANNIKFPEKAGDFINDALWIKLYAKINKKGEITDISEKPKGNFIGIDEIVVVGYRDKGLKVYSNDIKKGKMMQDEAIKAIKKVPLVNAPELKGETIQFNFKFVLQ